MGESKEKYRIYKAWDKYCNLCIEENLPKLTSIIPTNYLTKGRKYLMFVGTRKVGFLVDKLQFNFYLIYYFFLFILFIQLFISSHVYSISSHVYLFLPTFIYFFPRLFISSHVYSIFLFILFIQLFISSHVFF